jgi:hypothetical protein
MKDFTREDVERYMENGDWNGFQFEDKRRLFTVTGKCPNSHLDHWYVDFVGLDDKDDFGSGMRIGDFELRQYFIDQAMNTIIEFIKYSKSLVDVYRNNKTTAKDNE